MSFEARSALTPPVSEPALKSLDPSHLPRFSSATSPSPSQSDQDTCETSSLAELGSPSCNSINSVLPRSSQSLLDSATPLPPSSSSLSSSMSEADVSLAPVSETPSTEASQSLANGDHADTGMALDSEASAEQADVDMTAASSDSVDTQAASSAVPATDSAAAANPDTAIPAFDDAPPAAVDAFPIPSSDSATPANSKKRARRPTGLELDTPVAGARSLILTPEQAELKRKKLSKGYALVAESVPAAGPAPEALPAEDGKRPKRTRVKPEPMPALVTNGHSTPRARTPSAKAVAAAAGVKRKATGPAPNVDQARVTLLRTKLELLKQRLQQVQLDPSIVLRAEELPVPLPVDASAFTTPAPANRRSRPAVSSMPRARSTNSSSTPATARPKSGHKPPMRPPAVDVTSPSSTFVPPSPGSIVPVPLSSPYHGAAATPSTPSSFPAPSPSVRVTARSNRTIKTPKHLEATALAPALSDAFGRCKDLLARFSRHKHAYPFVVPVDWEALNIPTYPQIIKNPMDLGTIRDRLDRNHYESLDAFKADVDLVWHNAMTFNPPDHIVHNMASVLKQEFDEAYVKVVIGGLEKKRLKKKSPFGLFSLDMPSTPDGSSTPSGASKTPRARSSATAALSEELAAMRQCMAQMQEQLRQATTNPKSASRPRAQNTGPLTYQERAEIKEDIQRLPHDKLLKAVEIISISHPDAAKADGEDLEIDFDQLGTACCRKLQKFIRTALYGRGRGGGGGRGRGRGRGGAHAHHSSYDPSPSPSMYDEMDPSLIDINTGYAPTERLGGLTTTASIEAAHAAAAYAPPSDSDSDDDSSDSDGEGGRKRKKYPQPGMGFAASAAMTAGLAPDAHKKKRGRPARPIVPTATGAGTNPSFGDPSLFAAAPIDLGHALSASTASAANNSTSEVKSVDANAWGDLGDDEDAPAAAQPSPTSGGNLWADFKTKDEEAKQKLKERAEQEERLRRERERIEAERRREAAEENQRRLQAEAAVEAENRRQREAEQERIRSAGEQNVLANRNLGADAASLQASLEAELFGDETTD